jgi:hypothetical protein
MRVSVMLLLFFVGFNAGAQILLIDTGISEELRLNPELGDTSELDQVSDDAREVNPGSGIGSTLFSLWNSLANGLSGLLSAILPGARLLKNAGFPSFWVDFAFTSVPIIIGLDTISFLRGYDLL